MLQLGSEASSTLDTSRPVSLTSATSGTFSRASSPASRSATSLRESASGRMPCDLQGGPMTDLFGQVPVRANLSARQAKALGLMTSGTCGRLGTTSSKSAALSASLESRLRAATASSGSTLFTLTWKRRSTPSGLSICALRGSALRTSGNAFGSWPTPMAGTPAQNGNNAAGNTDSSRKTVALVAPWTTPTTRDWKDGSEVPAVAINALLGRLVWLAHWPTTTSQDAAQSRAYGYGGQTFMTLTDAARSAGSGDPLIGFPVETTSGGPLNPGHSRWLQGLPPAWCDCAVTAMQSMPKRRASSSKRASSKAAAALD